MNRVTFSNNSSNFGGGMLNQSSSSIVAGVTFFGNRASIEGGGMYSFTRTTSLPIVSSSIFWGNTKGSTNVLNQIYNNGLPTLPSHSVIQGDTTNSRGIIANNPELRALENNGGFIKTMAIGATSSAKDKGLYFARVGGKAYYSIDNMTWYITPLLTGTSVTTLPKGVVKYTKDAREYGYSGRPDMGAYEYNGTAP